MTTPLRRLSSVLRGVGHSLPRCISVDAVEQACIVCLSTVGAIATHFM